MICWTNYFNKIALVLIWALFSAAGCARLELEEKPPLTVKILPIEQQGPLAARLGSLRVSAGSSGGEGEVTYRFYSVKSGLETIEQAGKDADWLWTPKEPGTYRLRVTATDGAGEVADSGWSAEYAFDPPVDASSLYAVLPVDNLSGARAPLKEIQLALRESLSAKGFQLLDPGVLDEFMKKYRVRHTGGLSSEISRKLREEAGVDGVFITSLEAWQEGIPPRVSLITRVVLSGDLPEIVWMDSAGLTGNDAPGLFGTGRIKSSEQLLTKCLDGLISSFQLYLQGGYPTYRFSSDRQEMRAVNGENRTADFTGSEIDQRHQPRFTFRAPDFDPAGNYSVAVVPFLNVHTRKNAGDVVALHFVKQLSRYENLQVFEPGLVRQTLLNYRMIMVAGPSLAVSDVLANETILGADLVLSGKVFDYQGERGMSKVDFSVQAFDSRKREVIWTSRSHATSDDGVYFFDLKRVPSAHGLATRMSKAVAGMLVE